MVKRRPGVSRWPGIAVLDMLALGTEVEVLHPPELRAAVREAAARIAARHSGPADGATP